MANTMKKSNDKTANKTATEKTTKTATAKAGTTTKKPWLIGTNLTEKAAEKAATAKAPETKTQRRAGFRADGSKVIYTHEVIGTKKDKDGTTHEAHRLLPEASRAKFVQSMLTKQGYKARIVVLTNKKAG